MADGRQDQSGENGPSNDLDLGSDDQSSVQTTFTQETCAEKKSESTDNVTSCVDPKEGDASGKNGSDGLIAEADSVLNVRPTNTINRAMVEQHSTPFAETHPNRGDDSLKGSGNQVDGLQGVGNNLLKKKSVGEVYENRLFSPQTEMFSPQTEIEDEENLEEDQRMGSLKNDDEALEHDDIEQNGEHCAVANKQFIDECNFGSVGENETQENTERMDNLKDSLFYSELKEFEILRHIEIDLFHIIVNNVPTEKWFLHNKVILEMAFRGILLLFFNQEKQCKKPLYRMTIKEHDSVQKTVAKSLLSFEELDPMVRNIDLYAVRITVTPIPVEAREEAYRLSSFEHYLEGGVHLDFYFVMVLVRNGYFCNANNDIVCAFCGRFLSQYYLRRQYPHMRQFLNHRAHCIQHGNISMDNYGLNLADRMGEASNGHQLYVSGMPFPGLRVCLLVQQLRNIGLQNVAPSGSVYSGTHGLPSLPAPNIPNREQERIDAGVGRIPTNLPEAEPPVPVHVEEGGNQPALSSCHTPKGEEVWQSVAARTTFHADYLTGATGTSNDLPGNSGQTMTNKRDNSRHTVSASARETPRRSVSLQISARSIRFHVPEYADIDRRIESFQSSRGFHQTPQEFAQAGFYYNGLPGIVQCFCCGVDFGRWEIDDDPLIEHIREHPNCDYIQAMIRDSVAERHDLEDRIVGALVDSCIGSEMIKRGFSREEVATALRRLIRRGERVSVDTVANKLRC